MNKKFKLKRYPIYYCLYDGEFKSSKAAKLGYNIYNKMLADKKLWKHYQNRFFIIKLNEH